jgi:hypothetical protein
LLFTLNLCRYSVDALVATQRSSAASSSSSADESTPGNPVADPSLLNGDWECVMSTKQLFRSSPFFMVGL